MSPRIFLFALFITLARSEPSVIDSLTIQIPSEPEYEKPHLTEPKSPYFGALRRPTTSTSTSTSTSSPTSTTTTLKPPFIKSNLSLKLDDSNKSLPNPVCPGIVCYTMTTANGSTLFDCTNSLPQNAIISHELDCSYWQPPSTSLIPIAAKFFTNGPKLITNSANQAVTLRIVLKPRTENPNLRITADSMVLGALTRLVEAVKRNVKPLSTTPIRLSLIMVKIKRLAYEDLADVFRIANMGGLILWNPDYLEETSFLQNADKVSTFTETYVRLTFYCETENDFPAFARLWLPWLRWQVKFLQCRGHYHCYKWPREERLCCNRDRCPETPGYVITHADKLANRDPAISLVHQQQVLDFYSCETESDLTNPLVELRKRDNCWSVPGYDMINTYLRLQEPSSTTTVSPSEPLLNPIETASVAIEVSKQPPIQQSSSIDNIVNHMRMRNLVIGIICLLLLNLLTFICFVIACCWAWRKFGVQHGSNVSTGISGSYEKQDNSGSEMAPTPLFTRSGVTSSYEHTPVMGSRDALLPGSVTPGSLRLTNGRASAGRNTVIARSGHPHTIVIEGEAAANLNPSQIFSHGNYV
ncbi:unnamed protein product [Hymenolepis diminuta]|uniref:Uncharacterized protein n=1 Tax=Hymenolepis diminuta TaxID=6216 RepID=A0A0R3SVG3_HYMDI|nr:unnamed protein product [Hymenolepis diminuta]VUZ43106.1 unnamed protein product [Hymenolepis diminuta]